MERSEHSLSRRHPTSAAHAIDSAIADLLQGARRLVAARLEERIEWIDACIDSTAEVARDWVETACAAKRIPSGSAARAEEILAGPVAVVRYLQLVVATFRNLQAGSSIRLRGKPRVVGGQVRVPTFPTRQLYDSITLRPLQAETWLEPTVGPEAIFGESPDRLARRTNPLPQICLVLGAGNVSAIPFTDVLTCILQNDNAVLLKMNPVNDYLGTILEHALHPLISAGVLRTIYGDSETGQYAIHHRNIDSIHITGSTDTHDAIIWGSDLAARRHRLRANDPLLRKPVTSELGNVTPWAIVPGQYSASQLRFLAENIATSIVNNASFNCVATKMVITSKAWPARQEFLDLLAAILEKIPRRYAYYPGASVRFAEFSGSTLGPDDDGRLPWTLRPNLDPTCEPHLFDRESFVCVTGEVGLDSNSPDDFLPQAVEFMNHRLRGTLAAALTVPKAMQGSQRHKLEQAVRQLCYGTIGVNQWPGVAYALMSTPWGGFPGANLNDVQSGLGHVHNTYFLNRPQKTVLMGPLTMFPKPLWFSTHGRAEILAWQLFEMYCRPTAWNLLRLVGRSLR